MLQHEHCQFYGLMQGHHDGIAIKPTRLLLCNGDYASNVLAAHQTIPNKVCPPLAGKRADGTWATVAAKEYPSDFCKGLAACLLLGAAAKQAFFA